MPRSQSERGKIERGINNMLTLAQRYPLNKLISEKYKHKIRYKTLDDNGRQVIYDFGNYQVSVIYGPYSYELEAGLITNNKLVDWPDGSDVKGHLTKRELTKLLALAEKLSK